MIALALWSIYWKGRSLWKSARAGHTGWFIALLLINTAGILDILYIYVFSKPKSLPPANGSSSGSHHNDHTHSHDHTHEHHHEHTPVVQPSEDIKPSDQTL